MPETLLYIPFPDVSGDDTFSTFFADLRKAGVDCTMVDDRNPGFLAGVAADDLLLVAGHGIKNYNTLYMAGCGSITANNLRDRLANDGRLPKTHRSILLMSCFAGGNVTGVAVKEHKPGASFSETLELEPSRAAVKHGETPDAPSSYKCMASLVAKALGQQGYQSIRIGGFPGEFAVAYREDFRNPQAGPASPSIGLGAPSLAFSAKNKNERLSIGAEVSASGGHIQWFNAKGALAP